MDRKKPLDVVKEVVWDLVLYALYYAYSFFILILFHFFTYRFIDSLDWTLRTIASYAFVGATVMIGFRIVRQVKKN